MTEAIEIYTPHDDMTIVRPPDVVLAEARKAAMALKDVVSQKPKPVMMNGEQYLEFEDWQTVGKFYGITAKVESTTFIDYGGARGFEARAVALTADGRVISAADAMCLNDESKWSTRAKYEYVNGARKKTGEEPVPLFQLRSMAQTRACSKALRNVLSWVVVLAGYKSTPAEEIKDMADSSAGGNGSGKTPQSKSQAQGAAAAGPKDPDKPISEGQKKLIFAKSKAKNVKEDDIKAAFCVAHIADLTMGQMNAVIEFIEKGVLPGAPAPTGFPADCPKDSSKCDLSTFNAEEDMKPYCGEKPCPYKMEF